LDLKPSISQLEMEKLGLDDLGTDPDYVNFRESADIAIS
jgi:hypothetical protein